MRRPVPIGAGVLAVSALAGCASAPPRVSGVAGAPPSPSAAWSPPPRAIAPEPPATAASPTPVPADLTQRIQQLTLADVVDLALRNNPATRVSWAQARAAADVYGASQGGFLPTVTGEVTVARTRTAPVGGISATQRSQLVPTLSLNYLLFDFGGRTGAIEQARQSLFAADLSHNAILQTTILQAETAYFGYMATNALLGAERSAIAEAQANLAAAEQRHNVGLATIADVLQARTALSQEQLNLETIEGNLQAARGALAATMGLSPTLPYDLEAFPPNIPVRAVALSVDSIINEAVRARPDLAAARAQAAAAAANVRVVRAEGLPSLTVGSNFGRTYSNPERFGGQTYGLTFGISIPIFTGFVNTYNVAAAREQATAATARADLTRQQVITQAFTSYYALQTAEQRVTTADALLASALASERVAAGRYREGVGSIVDLLTAQTALANARAQQVQSRWQWYTALAQLAHDAGVLGTHGEMPLPFQPDSTSPRAPPTTPDR